jgi:hypothetical protein
MSVATSLPFPADALEANRAGQLTQDQRQRLGRIARADRKNEFTGSFIFAAMGLLVLFGVDSSKPPLLHYGFPAACFAVVLFLLYRSTSAGDALTRDLHGSKVQSVEGAITKWVVHSESGNSSMSTHFIEVDRHRFEIWETAYEAIPDAGIFKVYYLPQSKHVVNLEHLPDRPLPAGAIESPMETLTGALTALRSHDSVQAAEARATMEALGNAEKALLQPRNVQPPAPDQRDPRPLAEAILGTWQLGPTKVTFKAGGTATLALPMGGTRDGHWSVDSAGQLHLDALNGRDQATSAWVVGDSLTVSLDGQGMTAHRVAG